MSDFLVDLNQCWVNAYLFNPPGNAVRQAALDIARGVKKGWETSLASSLMCSSQGADVYCVVCGCSTWEEGDELVQCGDGNGAGCGRPFHQCCEPGCKPLPEEGLWFCPYCTIQNEAAVALSRHLNAPVDSPAVQAGVQLLEGGSSLAVVAGTAPLLMDSAAKRQRIVTYGVQPGDSRKSGSSARRVAAAATATLAAADLDEDLLAAALEEEDDFAAPRSRKRRRRTPISGNTLHQWKKETAELTALVRQGGEGGVAPSPNDRMRHYYQHITRAVTEAGKFRLPQPLQVLEISEHNLAVTVASLPGVIPFEDFSSRSSATQAQLLTQPCHPSLIDLLSPQLISGVPIDELEHTDLLARAAREGYGPGCARAAAAGAGGGGGEDGAPVASVDLRPWSKHIKGLGFCVEEEYVVFAIHRHAPEMWSVRYKQYLMTRASDMLRVRVLSSPECLRTKLKNCRKTIRDRAAKGKGGAAVREAAASPDDSIRHPDTLAETLRLGLSTVPEAYITDKMLQAVATNIGFRLARWKECLGRSDVPCIPPCPVHLVPQFYAPVLPGMHSYVPPNRLVDGQTRPDANNADFESGDTPLPDAGGDDQSVGTPSAASVASSRRSSRTTVLRGGRVGGTKRSRDPPAAPAVPTAVAPTGTAHVGWPLPAGWQLQHPPAWASPAVGGGTSDAAGGKTQSSFAQLRSVALPPLPATPCPRDVTKDIMHRLTSRWGIQGAGRLLSGILSGATDAAAGRGGGAARCRPVPPPCQLALSPPSFAAVMPNAKPSQWRVQTPGVDLTAPPQHRGGVPPSDTHLQYAAADKGSPALLPTPLCDNPVDMASAGDGEDAVLALASASLEVDAAAAAGDSEPASAPQPDADALLAQWLWSAGPAEAEQAATERSVRAAAGLVWAFHCARGDKHVAQYEAEVAATKAAYKAGTPPPAGKAWMYGIACLRMVTGMGPRLAVAAGAPPAAGSSGLGAAAPADSASETRDSALQGVMQPAAAAGGSV